VAKAKVWLWLHITKDHTLYEDTEGLITIVYGIKQKSDGSFQITGTEIS
jgi:hypothetical protein